MHVVWPWKLFPAVSNLNLSVTSQPHQRGDRHLTNSPWNVVLQSIQVKIALGHCRRWPTSFFFISVSLHTSQLKLTILVWS
jgi:hypothetical protein